MEHFLTFAYPKVLLLTLPLVGAAFFVRRFYYKPVVYRFSLANFLQRSGAGLVSYRKKIFWCVRFFSLLALALLIAKPQWVDVNSRVQVEGLDIVLVLDASGSMQFPVDEDTDRAKFDVAKEEAVHFIEKRNDDAIGLVIFAKEAIARCPLTLDKQLLKKIVQDTYLGIINPDGTVLATSMIAAANRLKESKAKSKVMILLTDGAPSEEDKDLNVALKVVNALDIKVYTIGFGSDKPMVIRDPMLGLPRLIQSGINIGLLQQIAERTGGQFFHAHNARDMRAIYDTIDKLETTKHEATIFSKYYDIFMPFVWLLFILLVIEIIMSAAWWFAL